MSKYSKQHYIDIGNTLQGIRGYVDSYIYKDIVTHFSIMFEKDGNPLYNPKEFSEYCLEYK